jgi:hypothetical protein
VANHRLEATPGRCSYLQTKVTGPACLSRAVGVLTGIAMKRHILLALFRLLLAPGVACALSFSHAQWGERYPGDGQQGFGFLIVFFVIGLAATAVFVGLGSLGQFLLRKRSARFTVFTDLALFLVFAGVLIYGGVSAKYIDAQPNKSPEPTATLSERSFGATADGAVRSAVAVGVTSRRWLGFPRYV